MASQDNVELVPYNPEWHLLASQQSRLLADALGDLLVTVHHIGSTAIPTIAAKPILNLMPVVKSLDEFDQHRNSIEALGYQWRGEYGLVGRRYCTKADAVTGRKLIHLHVYELASAAIDRHVAFRNYLLERPDLAQAYHQKKVRCQQLHRNDSQTYSQCKSEWIKRVEAEALAHFSNH